MDKSLIDIVTSKENEQFIKKLRRDIKKNKVKETICDDCEKPINKNDILLLSIDSSIKTLCRICAEDNYFECDECNQFFSRTEQYDNDASEDVCLCKTGAEERNYLPFLFFFSFFWITISRR